MLRTALRTGLWTLRQPRYAALAALLFAVALGCVGAGTWQISRFQQSVRDNDALGGNAHAVVAPLTTELVPLVGGGAAPGRDAIRFRTVTTSGSYLAGPPEFVRNETQSGNNGYYLLSPLRTSSGVLLVIRGFVAAAGNGNPPGTVPAPPAGPVHITGRLQTADSKHDAAGELGNGELESINPVEQAGRLRAPVYNAYLTLTAHQPGTSGVSVLPDPDLSNPAGGAYEAQHFAYIIQWYLFALLALAAPFAMGRSEVREAQRRLLGIDPGNEEFGIEAAGEPDQRPRLTAGASAGGGVAVRDSGTLARRAAPTPEQWQRAAHLADRYGRSLGRGHELREQQAAASGPAGAAPSGEPGRRVPDSAANSVPYSLPTTGVPNSAARPHRSYDGYHGSYNDYLWELALADAEQPDISVPRPDDQG